MEILNLKINDSLDDWGIIRTAKIKTIVLKDKSIDYDVYKIPLDILVYNASNGRMFMEAKKYENEEHTTLEDLKKNYPDKYNDEVENMIWSTNEAKNTGTKKDIGKFGQLEAGVVLDDGTVIDGNRRFTCLRRLHHEHPDDERYKYFLAAIIHVDGQQVTHKLLKEYELRVQFGSDEKVNYNPINKNMSIYYLIKNGDDGFDFNSVADLLGNGTKPGDVSKIFNTCTLVDEFLEYIGQKCVYQIAEDLKIYWPLEPFAQYISSNKKNLSELELLKRKHLYFDYLLTLDVALITQNLRDGLIKKIFKDKEETDKLIIKHNEIIGDKIKNVIENSDTLDDFNRSLKSLKSSSEVEDDKDAYESCVNRQIDQNQLDVPLKECKSAKKCLENVNLKHLIKASNALSELKLSEIKTVLKDLEIKVKDLISEIDRRNEK